jgi:hypothetical protein
VNSATKAELQQAREILRFLLRGHLCFFCREHLIFVSNRESFGHRRHSAIVEKLTIHHINEDREDNRRENLVLCHSSCHRSYHVKKRIKERADENATPGGNV